MKRLISLTNARLGAWVVSLGQIFLQYPPTEDTARFEEIIDASKAGKFLQTISSDKTDDSGLHTIPAPKMLTYGLACKIGKKAIHIYLDKFKSYGMIDFNVERTEYKIISKDQIRVFDTVYRYFDESGMATDLERVSIHLMEFLNIRPRTYDEMSGFCTSLGLYEEGDLKIILRLFETYSIIIKVEDGSGGVVYYSTFQSYSEGYEHKLLELTKLVEPRIREQLDSLTSNIYGVAGLLKESAGVPDDVIMLAASLGLVEVMTVDSMGSGLGSADFIMPPALKAKDNNQNVFENDVFHNAKLLLSSIRFGEQKSTNGRGRIMDPIILMNKLLEDNEVGPCTAIGQDYGILELEGVIETTKATNRPGEQYSMYLRKREPARVVRSLLEKGFRSGRSVGSVVQDISFPMQFNPPEVFRRSSHNLLSKSAAEAKRQLMFELRTS